MKNYQFQKIKKITKSNKLFILTVFLFSIVFSSNAQIDFGVKAGLNYNKFGDSKFGSIGGDIITGAKGKAGFHIGVYTKVKIPVIGIYLRPELVYTQIKSGFSNSDFKLTKIDIPILVGTKIIGPFHAFIGPAFQFVVDSDIRAFNIDDIKTDDFSLGVQMGFGIELGKLGIDVRWERGLSNTESIIYSLNSDSGATIDTRPNQIIFGLSYRFGNNKKN